MTNAAAIVVDTLKLLESMIRTSPPLVRFEAGCCDVRKAKSSDVAPNDPAAVFWSALQWARNGGLKNKLFPLGHFLQGLLAYSKIIRQRVVRSVRHPVGKQHRFVFRESLQSSNTSRNSAPSGFKT